VGELVLSDVVRGVVVSGGFAYVANVSRGLRVIDVSTPSSPVEVGFMEAPGHGAIESVEVSGSYAYVGYSPYYTFGYPLGLGVIDISTPSSPHEVGYLELDWPLELDIANGYVYAVSSRGLRVIDLSRPSFPVEVGFSSPQHPAGGIAVSGELVVVTEGWAGIEILDVSGCTRARLPHRARGRMRP
jgi:hypothetical protein